MAKVTNLSLRRMTLIDIEKISDIEEKAHYHPWSKKSLKEAISAYQCWVLHDEQQLIGYGILKIILDEAELLNIAVKPALHGNGFGKHLLHLLMHEAKKQGAYECFLEVRESNHIAYHLYENYGFNEIGRRANYYPTEKGYEDALIMAYIFDNKMFN